MTDLSKEKFVGRGRERASPHETTRYVGRKRKVAEKYLKEECRCMYVSKAVLLALVVELGKGERKGCRRW